MGTTLTGKKVQNTYDSLLKLSDNDNLTSTAKIVGDGLGNNSPIYLSTSKVGINVTPTFEFQTNSHAKIGGDLTVGGNFTVNGTTTIVDSTVIAIGDNMMEMAKDNSSNTMDIGWYGTINSSGEKYVGVFYDASSGVATPEFHIGLGTVEPSSTAAWTVKGKLVIGALDATTGVFSGQVTIPATPVASTDAASKGYVDAQITAQDLDIAGDSGTGAVDLDSQTFTISGGTNVTTSVSGQTVTINATGAVDGSGTANDVVMWQDSNTLTDAPIAISGNNATFAGTVTSNNYMSVEGSSSGAYIRFKHSTGGLNYVGSSESLTGGFGDENDMLNYSVSGKWGVYTNSALALTIDESQNATFAGDVSLGDNKKLKFGAAPDYEIYHDSTTNVNHIQSLLDRQLAINANTIFLRNQANSVNYLQIDGTSATFAGNVSINGLTNSDYDADADNLVLGTTSGNTGITIVSGSSVSNFGSIYFADGTSSTAAKAGYIRYEQNTSKMTFGINAVEKVAIDLSGNTTFAGTITAAHTLDLASDGGTGYTNSRLILNSTESSARGAGVFIHNTNDDQEWYAGVPYNDAFDSYVIGHKSTASHADSTSELANALLMIESGGNVGIGTTSPSVLLDARLSSTTGKVAEFHNSVGYGIGFTVESDGGVNTINSESNQALAFATNGASNERMRIDSSGDLTMQGGRIYVKESDLGNTAIALTRDADEGYVQLFSSGTQTIEIRGNGNSYFNSGNIGIGTTSPVAKFEVTDGSSSITLQEYSNGAAIFLDGVNGDFIGGDYYHIFADGSSYLGLGGYGGGTTPLNINSSGKVGIGTTSPSSKLTIVSDASVGSLEFLAVNAATTTNKIIFSEAVLGDESFFIEHDGAGAGAANLLKIFGDGAGGTAGGITIQRDGKVGIGTTSPTNILHVHQSDASSNSYIHITHADGGSAATDGISIGLESDGVNAAIRNRENGYLRMFTNNTERMRIHSNGRVSIGVTTASANTLTLSGTATEMDITNTSASGRSYRIESDSAGLFVIKDRTANADRIVLNSSGNVGIATTSPSQLLHCNGNALIHKLGVNAFNASFDFYNNGTTYLNGATTIDADLTISETNGEINFSSGNGYVQTTTGSTSLVLGTNSTEVLRCHSTGKVGINVTSPTEKLDVVDDGGNTNIRVYDSSGNSEVGLKLQNDAKTWTLQNWGSGGDNLRILNNAGNTIQLWDDNGNVGINNTSTSYKLDVTGQIRATDDIIAFSDIRVKENVKTLENSLSKVNNLRGVEFNKIGNNNKSIGVIAQEIEKILPEVVHTDNEGMKSVAYGNITGLLIEAVKELSKEVQELKKQIK